MTKLNDAIEEKNLRKNIEEQCLGFQKEKDDLYLKNEK